MEEDNESKKRFFGAVSWLIIVAYLILNIALMTGDTSLEVQVVTLPLLNLIFIVAWFLVRSFYNKASSVSPSKQDRDAGPSEILVPTYGESNRQAYTPNLTIPTNLFADIMTDPGNKMTFDLSMSGYLKKGQTLIFHDEMDYGVIKNVSVIEVSLKENGIEVAFSDPEDSA